MTNNHPHQKPSLNADERAEMRRAFVSHMETNPETRRAIPSPYLQLFRAPAFSFALALLVVGGTAYGSEQALPNDFLYPMKTTVIEPVFIKGLAWTAEQRAAASATLIERRFEEVHGLVSEERLDSDTAAYLLEAIEHEAHEGAEAVEKLRRGGSVLAALERGEDIETVLEAHAEALDTIGDTQEPGSVVATFADEFEQEIDLIESTTERAEDDVFEQEVSGIEGYIDSTAKEAEGVLEYAREQLENQGEVESPLIEEALDRLEGAERAYTRGIEDRTAGDSEGALQQLRYALQAAEKAAVLIDAHEELAE